MSIIHTQFLGSSWSSLCRVILSLYMEMFILLCLIHHKGARGSWGYIVCLHFIRCHTMQWSHNILLYSLLWSVTRVMRTVKLSNAIALLAYFFGDEQQSPLRLGVLLQSFLYMGVFVFLGFSCQTFSSRFVSESLWSDLFFFVCVFFLCEI